MAVYLPGAAPLRSQKVPDGMSMAVPATARLTVLAGSDFCRISWLP